MQRVSRRLKTLVIFDGPFDFNRIPPRSGTVDLLPMTGDWELIDSLSQWCRVHRGTPILLDAARLFDIQVHDLKTAIQGWSTSLGEVRVGHQTIKEWFLLPGVPVSGWWFSRFAEKNNIKEDLFLRLAQVMAIDRILGESPYDACVAVLESPLLRQVLKTRVTRRGEKMVYRKVKRKNLRPLLQCGRSVLDSFGTWAHVFHASLKLFSFAWRCWFIKRTMGPVDKRALFPKGNILVTYYPYVDREAIIKKEFQNTYLLPLQRKLHALGQKINWLCIVVPFAQWTFQEAVCQAKRLAEAGEAIFFLFEFMSVRALGVCVYRWVRQTITSAFLSTCLDEAALLQGFQTPEIVPILRALWRKSFAGWVGLEGLLYFGLFSEMIKRFPEAVRCVYCSEMQAWENALNAAKRNEGWSVETIGFQHSAISKNHYFYFPSPEEVRPRGHSTDLPLPDVMAVNGKIPFDYLSSLGFPHLVRLEAIRQLSLSNVLRERPMRKGDSPVLLLVGSYSLQESRSLLQLLLSTWHETPPCRIWFKPHPTLRGDKLLKECPILWPPDLWEVRLDPINELLREAWIVVGGESSVSINALAHGCKVIAPVLNDVAFMSPLDGFERYYEKVFNPDDLRKTVEQLLKKTEPFIREEAARSLVASFWDLDPALPCWETLLSKGMVHAPA